MAALNEQTASGNYNFESMFSNVSSDDGVEGTIHNIKYGGDGDNDVDSCNVVDFNKNKSGLLLNDKLL